MKNNLKIIAFFIDEINKEFEKISTDLPDKSREEFNLMLESFVKFSEKLLKFTEKNISESGTNFAFEDKYIKI